MRPSGTPCRGLPRTRLDAPASGAQTYSVRPQNLKLHGRSEREPGGATGVLARGQIAQRAYLGEHWDYLVRIEGGDEPLRVTTLPHLHFGLGEAVRLEIEPVHLVPIAP